MYTHLSIVLLIPNLSMLNYSHAAETELPINT